MKAMVLALFLWMSAYVYASEEMVVPENQHDALRACQEKAQQSNGLFSSEMKKMCECLVEHTTTNMIQYLKETKQYDLLQALYEQATMICNQRKNKQQNKANFGEMQAQHKMRTQPLKSFVV